MGPYSEERQYQRAEAIQSLLARSPDLSDHARAIWQNHLANIARNETTYNWRVREIYSKLNRGPLISWEE